ncbi:hypothetical protein KDL01_04240 [Actinospica durhamensis]|uniref:Uncharacterized protein n=1 Tax=Actinospica durhamensis TaxID=1508375 RepID=A0A941INV6_9ACTN|nr:hypothetical protein [Actinospica durhamensis]MBR7832452.1 hypothetical protein [Actinospica durhamensis]
MNGPYETSREAYDAARVLREAVAAADPGGSMTQNVIAARSTARTQYVRGVLEVYGVQLAAYDKRMAEWLAGWDVETIQTITAWIARAYAAGQDALREEITDLNARIAKLEAEAAGHVPPLPVDLEACGRCAVPFDPADTAFDGRARYAKTLFCRGCVDQCHEADADHRCIICMGGAR